MKKHPESRDALDPLAEEDASTFGRLTIAQARVHPDLVPDPTPEQRERVGEAARRLVGLRDGWPNPPGLDPADLAKRTLTNLYNQRPTWLANAHADLDAAVFAAYGWPGDLTDTEILERLLTINLARAGGPRTPSTPTAPVVARA